MLKKRMATVIVVIALALGIALLFPACNKNKSGKESYDYSKILKGDLSDFAGTYVDGRGDKLELKADGSYRDYFIELHFSFDKDSGTYCLGLGSGQDSFSMYLFPVGVDAYNSDGKLVKTDKTKIRLHDNNPHPSSSDDLYYWESSEITVSVEEPRDYDGPGGPQDDYPTIYYATANLRLRSEPDTSKDNRIAGVPQGSRVERLEYGQFEKIDNIPGVWYKVKTEDGTVGWLWSGYLTSDPLDPAVSYDYSKLVKGDFSDFSYTAGDWGAKDGSGKGMRLNADGTVINDKATADDEWVTQLRFSGMGEGGVYLGGIGSQNKKTGEGGGGAAARLYPIWIEIYWDDKILPSDTTKVRLWTGQDSSPNTYVSELSYFRKKSGAATAPAGSYDYAKILNKDFSDFAGNWKNGNGDRQQLKKDGIFGVNGKEIFTPKRESNGAYSWIVGSGQDGWHMKLYPVGTAVPGVQSDTTKVRLTMVMTPDGTASQAEIYYKD